MLMSCAYSCISTSSGCFATWANRLNGCKQCIDGADTGFYISDISEIYEVNVRIDMLEFYLNGEKFNFVSFRQEIFKYNYKKMRSKI